MDILYRFLGLNRVYETKHGVTFLLDPFLACVIFYVLVAGASTSVSGQPYGLDGDWSVIMAIIGLVVLYYFRRFIQATYAWLITRKRKYIQIPLTNIQSRFLTSALHQIDKDRDYTVKNNIIAETDTWKLFDVEYSFYRRSKHGRYKSKELHYTVFEIKLQRVVPHLIFDSKTAKGRQFRYSYLQSQRLSFEGNVDDYFDAYAPQFYHIDALSFITPEVLQEIVRMKNYDIEFLDNSLLCYGPLMDDGQVESFKQHGLRLHASVNDNLDTYRDDRLNGKERVEGVTEFGRQLLLSPMKYVPMLVLTGIGTMGILYYTLQAGADVLFNEFSAIVIITFFVNAKKIFSILRNNKKLKEEFDMHRTLQNAVHAHQGKLHA